MMEGQGMQTTAYNQLGQQNINYQSAQPVQPPADTLVRAISSLDELNKRLSSLMQGTYQIAEAIGGPYPTQGQTDSPVAQPSAMSRLNRSIEDAHRTVSDIEHAMSAIRRSLGA